MAAVRKEWTSAGKDAGAGRMGAAGFSFGAESRAMSRRSAPRSRSSMPQAASMTNCFAAPSMAPAPAGFDAFGASSTTMMMNAEPMDEDTSDSSYGVEEGELDMVQSERMVQRALARNKISLPKKK